MFCVCYVVALGIATELYGVPNAGFGIVVTLSRAKWSRGLDGHHDDREFVGKNNVRLIDDVAGNDDRSATWELACRAPRNSGRSSPYGLGLWDVLPSRLKATSGRARALIWLH